MNPLGGGGGLDDAQQASLNCFQSAAGICRKNVSHVCIRQVACLCARYASPKVGIPDHG